VTYNRGNSGQPLASILHTKLFQLDTGRSTGITMDKASITSDTHIGQVMTMTWHSKVNPLLYASPSNWMVHYLTLLRMASLGLSEQGQNQRRKSREHESLNCRREKLGSKGRRSNEDMKTRQSFLEHPESPAQPGHQPRLSGPAQEQLDNSPYCPAKCLPTETG
jgi:hypothetical protein